MPRFGVSPTRERPPQPTPPSISRQQQQQQQKPKKPRTNLSFDATTANRHSSNSVRQQPSLLFTSPPSQQYQHQQQQQQHQSSSARTSNRASEKVSLPRLFSCLAPDGRSILSLITQQQQDRGGVQAADETFWIEWQLLPLTTNTTSSDGGSGSNHNDDEMERARTMFQSPTTTTTTAPPTTTLSIYNNTTTVVSIRLPDHVQEALRRHAPLELICVDADSSSPSSLSSRLVGKKYHPHDNNNLIALPLLCVYTSKDAFILELAASSSTNSQDRLFSPTRSPALFGSGGGKVLSVKEPFESHLLDTSYSTRIVRIRPAPQVRAGYDTLCPPGSMAMLTYDRESNQYSLILYHGSSQQEQQSLPKTTPPFTTRPLTFGTEYLDEQDLVTDFCFAQSDGLSLLSSLSALFVQESGQVLCASPVLFDGTVVSRVSIEECVEFLQNEQALLNHTSAKWRQCKAAQAFLNDVFRDEVNKTRAPYLTARLRALLHRECAVHWPLAIQGPILALSSNDDQQVVEHYLLASAVSIEPFFSPTLVGVAIGRVGRGVDLALLSPSGLIPRFSLESADDRFRLDQSLQQLGVLVDRIQVDTDPNDDPRTQRDIPTLIPDPVVKTLLHAVSFSGVITISTNAMHVASQRICGSDGHDDDDVENDPSATVSTQMDKRTTAWSSLDVSTGWEGNHLNGAIVTRDARMGHVMIVRLSNGHLETINLTEARSLYDMEAMPKVEENSPVSTHTSSALTTKSTADTALEAIEAMTPLYALAEPLMKKVTDGLAGMGKIVGSSTSSKDVTPEMLATVLAVKERCERDVVLPLLELREVTVARHRELLSMYKRQLIQLESLKEMVKALKEREEDLATRVATIESNTVALSDRGAYLLQASQDLQPTLTRAEIEYFDMIKGLETKCVEWKEKQRTLEDSSAIICDSLESGRAQVTLQQLPPDFVENAKALLSGEATILKRGESRLLRLDEKLAKLASELGVGGDGDATTEDAVVVDPFTRLD